MAIYTGWPGRAKRFRAVGFDLETIKAGVWAKAADGIDVRIFDDADDS